MLFQPPLVFQYWDFKSIVLSWVANNGKEDGIEHIYIYVYISLNSISTLYSFKGLFSKREIHADNLNIEKIERR